MKVAAAAVNQMALDWDGNELRILEAMEAARQRGVSLLVFPESAIDGPGCDDALRMPVTLRLAWDMLQRIARQTGNNDPQNSGGSGEKRGIAVVVGLPVEYGGKSYRAAAFCAEGRIVGLAAWWRFAQSLDSYASRWFSETPPDAGAVVGYRENDTPDHAEKVPFTADPVFRIPESLAGDAGKNGRTLRIRFADDMPETIGDADLVAVPLAEEFRFGTSDRRRKWLETFSAQNPAVTFVMANLLGNGAGDAIHDGGNRIAIGGRSVGAAERFVYTPWQLTEPGNSDDEPDSGDGPEDAERRKYGDFASAISLGLWDYLRRSCTKGFVVSLSGGADSAAVATLASMALRRAAATLGEERFFAELGISVPATYRDRTERLVGRLLHTVYQGSENSSTATLDAAQQLADGLGAAFSELPIADFAHGYQSAVEAIIGREMMWETDDIALQNIQARVRVPGLWMLTNVKNAILLATGNRSEAAVGYTTMDGDTCGCIAPIGGIDKAFLRRFLRWMCDVGPRQWRAVPELGGVLTMTPTAELRPAVYAQSDEDDLMPYNVLDTIERMLICERLAPREIVFRLKEQYPDLSDAQIDEWVRRFFRLWSRNQWKRGRLAMSFRIDDHDLSPAHGARFPALSGGFARELREILNKKHKLR